MISIPLKEFSVTMTLLAAVLCTTDLPRYFQIEKKEREVEIDDRLPPALPAADSYVIGVKRALLPFRQLAKYLRRPTDSRQNIQISNRWDREGGENPSEVFQKNPNRKRWDKDVADDYPEIILVRPIDKSKLPEAKTQKKGIRSKVRSSNEHNTLLLDEEKCLHTKDSNPDCPRTVKIDREILQANGLNIKLTFSVDVGNQSKPVAKTNRGRMFTKNNR